MNFIETRGNDGKKASAITFSQAILSPMSSFGGVYCPESLPSFSADFFAKHVNSNYKVLAKDILNAFEIDIEQPIIDQALSLYDNFDDATNPVPIVKVYDNLYISELYHGPTRAFKDMALQPFGKVLSDIAEQKNEKYLILAATSGDTGPAALETFKNSKNVKVVCLYPNGGTSDVQRLQMVTETASNLKVIGINGDFDDAQTALKNLLTSTEFNNTLKKQHISLSAANSVNFGRIIFQTIYHIYSYLELVKIKAIKMGEKVYLNVPSGNFGNALGAYYALKMGLPVKQIHIASNNNNVLTKFITTGLYDLRNISVIATTSPAMDILKSSNVERILFDMFGASRTKQLMSQLDDNKYYQLTATELNKIQTIFAADFCTDEEGIEYIKQAFKLNYLMCPHTATCFKVYDTCVKDKKIKTLAYSTAEWTKFSTVIAKALTNKDFKHDLEALNAVAKIANITITPQILELFNKEVTQKTIVNKEQIIEEIINFLNK